MSSSESSERGPCRLGWISPEAVVVPDVVCDAGSWIGADVEIKGGSVVSPGAIIGLSGPEKFAGPVRIGTNVWIGPNVCIEPNVTIGDECVIGAATIIGSGTKIGNNARLGLRCTIMGQCHIGEYANLEAEVHVGEFSTLESHCQLMPGSILLNDPYPPTALNPIGPTIGEFAIVGVSAVIYPGVKLGQHAMAGALTVVKKDVPDYILVSGLPAREICDVRRIRCKIGGKWVYPYPWMRHRIPGEDTTKPAF